MNRAFYQQAAEEAGVPAIQPDSPDNKLAPYFAYCHCQVWTRLLVTCRNQTLLPRGVKSCPYFLCRVECARTLHRQVPFQLQLVFTGCRFLLQVLDKHGDIFGRERIAELLGMDLASLEITAHNERKPDPPPGLLTW